MSKLEFKANDFASHVTAGDYRTAMTLGHRQEIADLANAKAADE